MLEPSGKRLKNDYFQVFPKSEQWNGDVWSLDSTPEEIAQAHGGLLIPWENLVRTGGLIAEDVMLWEIKVEITPVISAF